MDYVNNNELLEEIKKFKKIGIASERFGEMIILIAEHYASIGSFSGYTWREDMVSEATLTIIKYIKNFDIDKSNNAFSYITKICKNSYRAYIKNQNKHSKIKDICYNTYEDMKNNNKNFNSIDYTLLN